MVIKSMQHLRNIEKRKQKNREQSKVKIKDKGNKDLKRFL